MKKLSHYTWAKVLAVFLCAISIFIFTASSAGMVAYGMLASSESETDIYGNKRNDISEIINGNISKNYAAYLLYHVLEAQDSSNPDWSILDGGNLLYTVTKDGKQVYSNNNGSVNSDNYKYTFFGCETDDYYYSADNFLECTFKPGVRYESGGTYCSDSINAIAAEEDQPRLYFVSDNYYFPINDFSLRLKDGTEYNIYWNEEKQLYNEQNFFWNTYDEDRLSDLTWEEIEFNTGMVCRNGNAEGGQFPFEVLSKEDFGEKAIFSGDYSQESDYVDYMEEGPEKVSNYEVFMSTSDTLKADLRMECGKADYFYDANQLLNLVNGFKKAALPIQVISLIISIMLIAFLTLGAGCRAVDDEIHLRWIDKIPYSILIAVTAILVSLGVAGNFGLLYTYQILSLSAMITLEIELVLACLLLVIEFYLSTVTRIKAHKFWRYTLLYYIFLPFRKTGKGIKSGWVNLKTSVREHTSLVVKVILILAGLGILQLLVIGVTGYSPDKEIWLFLIYKVIETIAIIWAILQLEQIKQGGKRVALGDYEHPIDTDGMFWEFKKHAENINDVGNGISRAVDERMKSEHFRTELITNVSHDIKTPLTSIINYVDLIKKEDITNPTLVEYIDVLDRQSARLKKLIEDLMEASKASTGNLKVSLEKFDATVMLTQVVGEFEEKTAASGLDLIVQGPEEPVYIMADGRHLYRVFDNLLSNVCKYAQPSTRVYINLEQKENQVNITFRNISKYQLNISSDELMERFVRGDSSRNTEGNGLGLSIAQSLMKLMNGTLKLDIDGDLFKVTLTFPKL